MLQAKIENFTEKEIGCRCCGKVNVSDKGIISLQAFRYYLNNKFKKNIRLNIESACRCIKHNKDEGGEKNSRHECDTKKSDAFDLISPYIDYKTIYQEAVACKLFQQLSGMIKNILYTQIQDHEQITAQKLGLGINKYVEQ